MIKRGQKQLTPEQEEYIRLFARERMVALFSGDTDERAAEELVGLVYREAGLDPPVISWFDSPRAFLDACWRISEHEKQQRQTFVRVWNKLKRREVARLRKALEGQSAALRLTWGAGLELLGLIVLGNVVSQVPIAFGQVALQRGQSLLFWGTCGLAVLLFGGWLYLLGTWGKKRLRGHPGIKWNTLSYQMMVAMDNEFVWGDIIQMLDVDRAFEKHDLQEQYHPGRGSPVKSYEAPYEKALYLLLHEMLLPNRLIHLARFNECVSGYYLGSEQAWLIRKPPILARDAVGHLHNSTGKAVVYRDGWGGYAWHGVIVPERLILAPETLTREDWMNEHDLEVRRVIQERMPNFVETVGAQVLDTGERGTLVAVDLGMDPEGVAHYVHMRDSSTEREYYLRVPPEIMRANQAVAWTFGLTEEEYQPEQEA